MDTNWFRSALKDKQISQRGLAKLIDLDPAAISLMFRSKRRMTPHEAHQIATILGVPLLEVMRRAGIEVTEDIRQAPVAGHVDASGNVIMMASGTHDLAQAPGDCPLGTFAVQVRSHTSTKDGWLLFISPTQNQAFEHLDKLCSCATSQGKQVLGVVRRGYRKDTQNLILWPSDETISDAALAYVSPVLWIKPA